MKMPILISVLILCTTWVSFSQWDSTYLTQGTIRMGSAILGNKAYFAGGMIKTGSNWYTTDKVEIYDMETGQWQYTNLSISRQWPSAVNCGDSILVAGGMNSAALPYSRIDIIYNDNLWDIAELSVPRFGLSAISYDNIVMFAGGFNLIINESYDVIDVYNASTHEWSVEYLSVPRGAMGCARLGDRVFFAGGCNDGSNSVVYDRVDIYSFTTGTWDIATLSQARSFIGAATAGNKIIFAGGSLGMGVATDQVDIYDSETDTWSTANLSIARGFWGNQAVSYCGKAYFVGSGIFNAGWDTDTDTIDIYDPDADEWSVMTMPNRLNDHAVVAFDSSMLIAGGFTFTQYPYGDPRSEVEIYVDPTVKIQEVSSSHFAVRSYPNPTRGIIDLQFTVYNLQSIRLRVYNAQGQEVAVVLDQKLPEGEHTVRWDAITQPPGIYFYRLEVGGQQSAVSGKIVKF